MTSLFNLSRMARVLSPRHHPVSRDGGAVRGAMSSHVAATAVCLALSALSMPPAPAMAQSSVTVTNLTSFHSAGENQTDLSGAPKGWPNIESPPGPPLHATHPASGRSFLFGGSHGTNHVTIESVGLWWMPAAPGHYDRLQTSDDGVFGTVFGPAVQSSSGHIYNVVASRRANSTGPVGKGLMFRTEFDGTNLEIIASTSGQLNTPNGALAIDDNDNIYGADQGGPNGGARLFKVDARDGSFHTVYEFEAGPSGKAQKPNGFILGSDGWIYGVNAYPRGIPFVEGVSSAPQTVVGSLYKIDPGAPVPANTLQVLHTFTLAQGEVYSHIETSSLFFIDHSLNYVAEGPDGWLYGTTSLPHCSYLEHFRLELEDIDYLRYSSSPLCGSATADETSADTDFSQFYDGPMPHGAIYRIKKDGSSPLQILHRFSYTDGSQPRGPLAVGKDGAIYGTTLAGGAHRQWLDKRRDSTTNGELFKEKPQRRSCEALRGQNRLYDRCRLYETAGQFSFLLYESAYAHNGTLYRIIPGNIRIAGDGSVEQGGFELLHSFEHGVDGRTPVGLTAGADGRLYGATRYGGQGYLSSRNVNWLTDNKGTAFMVDLDGDTPDASITMTFTPNEIALGANTTVTWTTHQARDCVASWRTDDNGNWLAVEPSGSDVLSPPSGTFYHTLQCVDEIKGAQISSTATLYVNAPITNRDGNHTDYGNGGGGSLPWQLLALFAPLLWSRQRRG